MPSKEVTNAAKAIYESRNGAGRTPWSQLPWSHKVPYLDDAEAARKSFLAALQEPTEAMRLEAAWEMDNPRSIGSEERMNAIIMAAINASPLGEKAG